MKNVLLPAVVALAACSSANGPGMSGPEVRASAPLIYVQSARQPDDITACLHERVFSVHETSVGSATEIAIGPRSNAVDWLITLTPSGNGSIVKVQKSANASDDIPEPELRFDIARCTT
ncbi:sugar ABC transporter ATPase [Pararobbsia alpina]|uniref:Sugar ABC transporter ATPase n=1 Tax=Pararobbsia alpina TaxID=621374 RepID=A0A6S7B9U2_9BURK|nr:sugar ABC transporter ATPase [Pararobbsia alpina]CAB3792705.1 hypothetical protein LMG28138_03380 [Pararobbsia alpina]